MVNSFHAKFQLIPFSSLPCRCDRPFNLFLCGKSYRIPTKIIGTEMHFNEPIMCDKFQLDGVMLLFFCLFTLFTKIANWRTR